jgi:uncharacterized protein YjbJ (UPF0337 family)
MGAAFFLPGPSLRVRWAAHRPERAIALSWSLTLSTPAGLEAQHHPNHHLEGYLMNKNQVDGRTREAKGKVKEVAGKVTGDKSTEYKGKAEKQAGKVEAKYGDVKRDVKKESK